MSKGSPIVAVRLPAELLARVNLAVRKLQERTREEPPTRNAWIVKAISEALAKRERSRKWRRPKRVKAEPSS